MADFTATGNTVTLQMGKAGEAAQLNISGTYAQTIAFERLRKPGAWEEIGVWGTANATVSLLYYSQRDDELLRAIARFVPEEDGGTAVVTLTDVLDDPVGDVVVIDQDNTLTTEHAGRLLRAEAAAGATIYLPRATGSGRQYRFIVGTAVSSNALIIRVPSGTLTGAIAGADTNEVPDTVFGWAASNTASVDRVSLNGTATGGKVGDYLTFTDMASGVYAVHGHITQSGGSEATPFAAPA